VDSPDRSFIHNLADTDKSKNRVTGCLKCWYANVTSLSHDKLDELKAMCVDATSNIIFISETWPHSGSIIYIEGYEYFSRDRKAGSVYRVRIYGKV